MSANCAPGRFSNGSIVRVLVVDDSAYVRKMVTQMLSRSPFRRGGRRPRATASEALELAARERRRTSSPATSTCRRWTASRSSVSRWRGGRCRSSSSASPAVRRAGAGGARSRRGRLPAEADGAGDRAAARSGRRAGREGQGGGRRADAAPPACRTVPSPRRLARADRATAQGHRRRGDRHLDRRAAGAQAADSAVARGLSRCRSRSCCTCRWATPSCTRGSWTRCPRCTVKEARRGRRDDRRPCALAPAGRHLSFRRDGGGAAWRTSTCGRSTRRIARRWTCCSSRPPRCTARATLGVVMTGMGADGREGAAGSRRAAAGPHRSRAVVRGVRHAAVGRRGGLERRERAARKHG